MEDALELAAIMLAVASPFLVGLFLVQFFRYRSESAARGGGEARTAAVLQKQDELTGELAELRQRIEVLESIVTDKRYELEAEIDGLRSVR